MNNIFDVFNNRKLGLNYLSEGYEVEADEVEAFDDLDTAMESLEEIITESRNEVIELQSAMYLEDLVLENMMYDDFNEEEISSVMENTMKERASELAKKIKAQWKKIQEWFVATAKAIANYFTNGENLVTKNKSRIPEAMKNCNVKVKMHKYNDPSKAMDSVQILVDKLKTAGTTRKNNDEVLGFVGAKDRKDIGKMVKGYFILTEKPVERAISEMSPKLAMDYAGNKKLFLADINKSKATIDQSFKEILSIIQSEVKKEDGAYTAHQVSVFNFAKGLSSTAINTEIACIKKGASEYASIIRKALNSNTGAGLQPIKNKLEARKAAKATKESYDGLEFLDGVDFE